MSEEVWSHVCRTPVKSIVRALSHDAGDIKLLAPPWGSSFQHMGKTCEPQAASSVQIHIRIAKSELRRILRASGIGGVYCTPKTEDRKVLTEYMIVWLNQSPVDFAVSLSKVDSLWHCAWIHGTDYQQRYSFLQARLSPSIHNLEARRKLPTVVMACFYFKVSPTPLGSTISQVQVWLTATYQDNLRRLLVLCG